MANLTRDEILNAEDMVTKEVEIPEWGGTVIVKTMTALERDAFEAGMFDDNGDVVNKNFRARLVAYTLVDDAGNPLFTEADAEELGKKSAKAMGVLFKVAQKLNGLNIDALEEEIKN